MSTKASESSLVDFFEANRADLRFTAHAVLRSAELVDDVMQDAYLRLIGVAAEVRSPIAYCRQIVRNLALDYCRHRAVEQACIAPDVSIDWLEAPDTESHHTWLEMSEVLIAIQKELDSMPPKTRQVFELHRLEGYTQRDVAKQLGCSLSYVNLMFSQAMAAVEKCRHMLD